MKKIELLTVLAVIGMHIVCVANNNEVSIQTESSSDTPESVIQKNYLRTTMFINESGLVGYTENQYLDGLGRLIQTVQRGFTPAGKDLVVAKQYDQMGLESKAWLSLPQTGSTGNFLPMNMVSSLAQTYYGDTRPYAEILYEADPLGQVSMTKKAGAVFQNIAAVTDKKPQLESDYVRKITIYTNDYMVFEGYYPTGKLYKTETMDEDGVTSQIFEDKEGRIILTRTINGEENIDTYCVYDFLGRLAVVITPEGSAAITSQNMQSVELPSDFVSAYCFSYRYDKAGNVIEQHYPGGFYEQILYNDYQQVWRRWEGQQNDYWGHKYVEEYSYDPLNRPKEISVLVMSTDSELSSDEGVVSSTPMMSYGYDNYEGVPSALAYDGGDYLAEPRGMKTYEKFLLMESNTQIGIMAYYIERAFYYDDKGRLKRMVERNHRDGVSHIDYQYDFCNNIIQRTEYIQPMADMSVDTLTVQYTYDHVGRMLSETTTLNSSDPVTVVFSYDELGQLIRRSDNGVIENTYAYNLQGWRIDGQAIKPGDEDPIFRYSLRYYDPRYNEQRSYTGNVSEWEWRHQNDVQQTYTFTYDSFGRMIDNRHYHGTMLRDGYAERNITYDFNGNIKTLKRYTTGNSGVDFAYTYEGGRLKSVQGKEYIYDHCGNVAHEGLEDLDITYNFLNLPWQIIRNRTKERIIYSYSADGKKVLSVDPNGHGLFYVGSLVYNHLDWYTPELESAPFSGGRIEVSEGQNGKVYTPYYYVTDHLGSVRAVVADSEVVDKCDYYPFGKKWITPESGAPRSRYCYNGKEQQWAGMSGLLDYGWRFYNPNIARWLSIDPMANLYHSITPYAYCVNNPIKYIDPDGTMLGEFLNSSGRVIGWDGKNDGRLYVIKTTVALFQCAGSTETVPGANLPGSSKRQAIRFIKENSGNAEAFAKNSIAYDCSIEIESDPQIWDEMYRIVSQDDGTGGTKPSNNREYSGEIRNNEVKANAPGPVVDLEAASKGTEVTTIVSATCPFFHSHASGTTDDLKFHFQYPTNLDLEVAGKYTCYVFARGEDVVYIYNSKGIQAIVKYPFNGRIEQQTKKE